jgi:catechol 2,3-dioxygenase-like lactoylglutathione lyase family enzyme
VRENDALRRLDFVGVIGFDHVVIPTADAGTLLAFYRSVGFTIQGEGEWRAGNRSIVAITFGEQKINVHTEELYERSRGAPGWLRGPTAEPGCGDFCFVWEGGIDVISDRLAELGIEIIAGPVPRIGARGAPSVSIYVRDPDENLLEFMSYDAQDVARYGNDQD